MPELINENSEQRLVLTVVLYRPGVAKGKGKEGKGKGPLGKHPISGAPKLDAALNRTDEVSDASDGDSLGANSSQEAADDSSHAGPSAAAHQGAPCSLLMPVFCQRNLVDYGARRRHHDLLVETFACHNHKLCCHKDTITSSHRSKHVVDTHRAYLSWVYKTAWQDWHNMPYRDSPTVPVCFVGVKVLERFETMQRSTRAHAGVCMLHSIFAPCCTAQAPYPVSNLPLPGRIKFQRTALHLLLASEHLMTTVFSIYYLGLKAVQPCCNKFSWADTNTVRSATDPGPASPSGSSSSTQSHLSVTRGTQRAASTSALSSSLVSSATQTLLQLPPPPQAVPLDRASHDTTDTSQQQAGKCPCNSCVHAQLCKSCHDRAVPLDRASQDTASQDTADASQQPADKCPSNSCIHALSCRSLS